jgi:2-methylcitrate dehydratase PrpD
MSLSYEIAKMVSTTRYEDLPEEVVQFTKYCILDWLGSALAGEDQIPVQMIRDLVKEMGGDPQASLIGGGKSSVLHAALLNGAASHVVELDDIHKASIIHAATVVIPAALAVAEWKHKSGKDLIVAVVIGYEICYRIGEAVSPSHYYYWHNTATCGTFGAAAAAVHLLDLTEEQIVHALGSAGTQAAGLWEFIENGSMSKHLHPGKAAMNGVISALLAEKGFTGATQILEGKRGFFQAMSEQFDVSRITEGLGEQFKIIENSFKIHSSCRHTHPAIDLILDIQKEMALSIDEVDIIHVKAYQVALTITDNSNPNTVYEAKFSLQFCTALAFVKQSAGLSDFNEQSIQDSTIAELMGKVEVSVDPEVNAAYPEKWGTVVEVILKNGDRIQRKTDYPKGDPELPVTEELIHKFRQITEDRPLEQVEQYISRIMNLEQLKDVTTLLSE